MAINSQLYKVNVKKIIIFIIFFSHWLIRTGPNVFSVYGQARRTHNNVESFHNKLKDTFQVCHPNLWKVLGLYTFIYINFLYYKLIYFRTFK